MRWAERVRRAGWLASSRAPRAVCASARHLARFPSCVTCYLSGQVSNKRGT